MSYPQQTVNHRLAQGALAQNLRVREQQMQQHQLAADWQADHPSAARQSAGWIAALLGRLRAAPPVTTLRPAARPTYRPSQAQKDRAASTHRAG